MKQRIAYNLRALGNWLFDACFWLAERLDGGFEEIDPLELKKSVVSMMERIELKRRHPCLTCGGTGGVAVEFDDAEVCPDCAGGGIDLAAINAFVARKKSP